jgi:P63C domain
MGDSMTEKDPKKVKAALARSKKLSPAVRRKIAQKAAKTRWGDDTPQATHDGEIHIGNATIFAAVLEDGTRLISQSTMLRALGRHPYPGAGKGGSSTLDELPSFLNAEIIKPFVSSELAASSKPIFFRDKQGTKTVGYRASILPEVAEVYLKLRDQNFANNKPIPARYQNMLIAADILIRGLASVGIIALVDEATGFQRDRASNALAEILEKFIAKELQPWVKTFPDEFYEHLFRLRGLNFPRESVKRPQYFGHLTNDIIYKRLAPGVLEELKNSVPKLPSGRRKGTMVQKLTPEFGHPKLREHLASVTTIMSFSDAYSDFEEKLNKRHPRYNQTGFLDFDSGGSGL